MRDTRQPRHKAAAVLYRRMMARRLFRRMMARHGVDLGESWCRGFEDMIFRGLRRCAACSQKTLCTHWLGQSPAPGYPSFCPNTQIIEACRIVDPYALPLGKSDENLGGEPPLADVLADPIVQQLMSADKVATASLPVSRRTASG